MSGLDESNRLIEFVRTEKIEVVDFRFVDLIGRWHHFSIPASKLSASIFQDGLGFDGSSMRGWKPIHESDMLFIPDPSTAFVDPFSTHKTLVITCDISDPVTGQSYERDPRYVAKKAEEFMRSTGIGDTAFFGPEAEFFIFDDVRFGQEINQGYYFVNSDEGHWNSGRDEAPNLGYKVQAKEGYLPLPPTDKHQDLRNEMMLILESIGIDVEAQHHEVSTGGQSEIDMKFDTLLNMADKMMKYKYVIKNTAHQNGKTVTFMPKPLFKDNGSGMHVHMSIWKDGKNLFAGDQYGGLSQTALHAIGGVLVHAPALLALTNPTTNSYKRLVPGYEAPVNLAYSGRNRSAAVRIPMLSSSEKAKRFEFRCPDPTANPYLAFSALLMAMIDGIQNQIDPGDALDRDIYSLSREELSLLPKAPSSLSEALAALEADHEFLLQGNVFTQDILNAWLEYKYENEVREYKSRPHPWEFMAYYDV